MAYNKETGMYEGYIYIILNDINPELVYIGQTSDTPEHRWNGHLYQIKKHTSTDKLHNKMRKYGEEHFAMEVLEHHKLLTKEALLERLDEREISLISKFDSYYHGLNSTKGGRSGLENQMRPVLRFNLDGNYIAEYEAIENLKTEFNSVSAIYDCCNHNNTKYAYGSLWKYKDDSTPVPILSENEKTEARIRYLSTQQIDKYDYSGQLICSYKNANHVLENEKITRRQLLKSCTGKTAFAGEYIYRFSINSFFDYKTYKPRQRIVGQYDLSGNLKSVYRSTREAERITGINNSSISSACNGRLKTAGGYIWKYNDIKGGDNVA